MKLVILISCSFLALCTNSQKNSSLIGKWQIVSMQRDGVYYNLKSDSVSFSKQFLDMQSPVSDVPDSIQRKIMAETMKVIALNFSLEFHRNGKFKFVMDSIQFVVEGNYNEIPSQEIIKLLDKKSRGVNDFNVADTMRYMIKNNQLYLSIDEDDEEFEFVLEKDNSK